jgi:hypothetical protein
MADFAIWGTACETAFWPSGAFEVAYRDNRRNASETVLEADDVALAIRKYVEGRPDWTGTASDLLSGLSTVADERVAKSRTWPKSAASLSGRLRRAATTLRKGGIDIQFGRESSRHRARTITVTTMSEGSASDVSGSSEPSAMPALAAIDSASSTVNPGLAGVSSDTRLPDVTSDAATSIVRQADGGSTKPGSADAPDSSDAVSQNGAGRETGDAAWSARI